LIVTDLEHLPQQMGPSAALRKILDFLRDPHSADLQPGRVDLDGNQIYALIQAYATLPIVPEVKFEAHRHYIDIQYIVSGVEVMGWAALQAVLDMTPYDPEKDACFGKLPAAEMTAVRVSAGQAAIFFPEDAHAPKLAHTEPSAVKKIVVKVSLDALRSSM
jgi:biofilm protein TabA